MREILFRGQRVDAKEWETGFIGIDYNGDGFFIDINYCPMCGRKLEGV